MQRSDVKLTLQWNEFHENLKSFFVDLKCDNDFTDVTLACEDGQQINTHKLILIASSPFFMNLLKKNKHSHPFVFMRGVTFENLSAMVDFLYQGEANVFQENLNSFLNLAEELKLRGLERNGTDEWTAEVIEKNYIPQNTEDHDQSTGSTDWPKGKTTNKDLTSFLTLSEELKLKEFNLNQTEGKAEMGQKGNFPTEPEHRQNLNFSLVKAETPKENTTSEELEELDLLVKSMMEVSENAAPSRKVQRKSQDLQGLWKGRCKCSNNPTH